MSIIISIIAIALSIWALIEAKRVKKPTADNE
jgi:hypothetical protein